MPKMEGAKVWPEAPHSISDEATLDYLIEAGYLLCGTPDEVNEQIAKYQEVGCDQLVFGLPNEGFEHEEVFEMLELFGKHVIPNFDTDPEHSTTRFRREAKRKYPDFSQPMPDGLEVTVIPTNALIPLAD
jgi:hypothetical protein